METRRVLRTVTLAALALGLSSGCLADASFQSKTAPDFPVAATNTVSVLGVYKDGMMSADAWDTFGGRLSKPFGSEKCDVAYGPRHLTKDLSLVSAIEEYARDNGVSDELLSEIAKGAKSDIVVVYTVAGHVKKEGGDKSEKSSLFTRGPTPQPIQRGSGVRTPPPRGSRAARIAGAQFTMSASFYATKQHRSVGYLSMRYAGTSEEEAFAAFNDKIAGILPHASCIPFEDAEIDAEKIRTMSINASANATPAEPQ
jgi:hypothetical protein